MLFLGGGFKDLDSFKNIHATLIFSYLENLKF